MSKMSKWKNEDTEHVVARADTCFSVPSEKPKHNCDSGDCVEVCEYEDFKLIPGTADSNNTHCLAIFCSEDFTITVHTCIHEEDPTCTFSHNYKKAFPDCCNQFCQSIVQLAN